MIQIETEEAIREAATTCIKRYGFAPEHSYEYFKHGTEQGDERIFFSTPEGYGLLAYVNKEKGAWTVCAEPIAPQGERGMLCAAVLAHLFSFPETNSVELELREDTRAELMRLMPPDLRARRSVETLFWPVLDLVTYDASLGGAHNKPLRNVQSRFLREHSLEVVDAGSISSLQLHMIVTTWQKNRVAKNRAYPTHYHALIDDNFSGTTGGRVLVVDGKPEAIISGWAIPNSEGYYLAVALHTYAYWGLGEMVLLEGVCWAQQNGYRFADIGGSGKGLLAFKSKLGDMNIYRTDRFSVVRKA